MPKLIKHGKEVEVKKGASIISAAEDLGVPFSCKAGICNVCEVEVVKGMKNLSSVTENEKNMGISGKKRLACQCKIKSGDVEIK